MPSTLGVVASSHYEAAAPAYLLEDDFTGTNGATWNTTKWPQRRGGTIDIQSNAGRLTAGGRPLAISEVTATDFELLVKGAWTSLSGINPEIGWRVNANIASSDPTAGYVMQLSGANVTIYTIAGYGGITSGSAGTSGLNTSGSWWFRIRVVGSNHKIRWWSTAGVEPGTWQINATSTHYLGGRFMLDSWGANPITWDDLQITDLAAPVGRTAARRTHAGTHSTAISTLASSDMSLTAWFKHQETPGGGNVTIFSTDSGGTYYAAEVTAAGFVRIKSNSGNYTTTFAPTINTWHFLGISRVASTSITTIRVAADGGAASTFTTTTTSGPASGQTFYIAGSSTDSFIGALGGVKVWSAALSVAQLDAERASYGAVRTSNLWAVYRFDTEPFTADTSGNTRTLTANAAVPHRVQGPTEPTT